LELKKQVTFYQRVAYLKALHRLFSDPASDGGRVLVEIYLNYDCDIESGAKENIWERLVNALAKTLSQFNEASQNMGSAGPLTAFAHSSPGITPALTTSNLAQFTKDQVRELYSLSGDIQELRKTGLELAIKGILKPLTSWCKSRVRTEMKPSAAKPEDVVPTTSDEGTTASLLQSDGSKTIHADDPTAFENMKSKKKALLEGIKRFNQKPKKGLQYLLETECISSRTSNDIARFLLKTEGLNKTMIGEYLGEG
jgi:brefeldin A-inhibited guanine nucleotide-exchange protein